MKTVFTCRHCVDANSKPDVDCKVRKICFDEASTTKPRKEIIEPYPEVSDQ